MKMNGLGCAKSIGYLSLVLNHQGSSLIQVLVSLSVIGILLVGIATSIVDSQKALKTMEFNQEVSGFVDQIKTALATPGLCNLQVTKKYINSSTPINLTNNTPLVVTKLETTLGNSLIDPTIQGGFVIPGIPQAQVTKIEIDDIRKISSSLAIGNFVLNIQKLSTIIAGPPVIRRKIPVTLSLDVSSKIVGCTIATSSASNPGETTPLAPGDCSGMPAVGTICSDGSVYAGISHDGSVKMYTTRCDYGQSWDGSACVGNRLQLQWRSASAEKTNVDVTNINTGAANTSSLAGTEPTIVDGKFYDLGRTYAAARACADLNIHEHDDWYLPALNELTTLYIGRLHIRNFATKPPLFYWTSNGHNDLAAWTVQWGGDSIPVTQRKDDGHYVRCVRK